MKVLPSNVLITGPLLCSLYRQRHCTRPRDSQSPTSGNVTHSSRIFALKIADVASGCTNKMSSFSGYKCSFFLLCICGFFSFAAEEHLLFDRVVCV